MTACSVLPAAERGRPVQRHWAYRPIVKPELPRVETPGQAINGIDHFILRRLTTESVRPAPVADPSTLLRRIHLDLTGLPPDPALVKSFLLDPSRAAYRAVVRQLLASPHYGERWGRIWLDMARYGDSNGYEADDPRPHAWRYRQWVIEALNRDLPFDQFTVQQLAGDLLPDATAPQKIATGFHRNTLLNTEGGVDQEEDRVKQTVDRTNTLGKVWLGITLECCQCHDHKFDSFSQDEYFGMYAFFNSLDERLITVPSQRDAALFGEKLKAFRAGEVKLLKALGEFRSETFTRWQKNVLSPQATWEVLRPQTLVGSAGSKLCAEEDFSVLVTGPNSQPETYTVWAKAETKTIRAIRLQVLADERLPGRGPGRAANGNFVLSSLRVFVESPGDTDDARRHRLASAVADFSQSSRQVTSVIGDDTTDGWAVLPKVGQDHLAIFALRRPITGSDGPVRLRLELDHRVHDDHNIGRFRLSVSSAPVSSTQRVPDADMLATLKTSPEERTGEQVLGLVRFFGYREPELDKLVTAIDAHAKTKPLKVLSGEDLADDGVVVSTWDVFKPGLIGVTLVGILLATVALRGGWGASNWSQARADKVDDEIGKTSLKADIVMARSRPGIIGNFLGGVIASVVGRKKTFFLAGILCLLCAKLVYVVPTPEPWQFRAERDLPRARVVTERRPPRETRIHHRGNFLDQGHVVRRATPMDLPELKPRGEVPDRLDLARWLVSRENPLTARVIVNRVWQQFFGRGIVSTDADFGSQGEAPSHPELLDWLAFRFSDPDDGAWSLKWLHELIVNSGTYRQSSVARPELRVRDPYNSWLARQNRLRVDAEIVRDLALSVSGLLDPRVGGPSVRPPQAADLVKLGFQNSLSWEVSTGGDRYRRGLYTFFQRTVPYPMLVTFDVPDSNVACTRRERSNTPLQALTVWNDPVFVECGQRMGRRLVAGLPMVTDNDQRARLVVRQAVRIGLGRDASPFEQRVLEELYRQNMVRYRDDEDAARQVIGPAEVPHTSLIAELAAAISVARVVLNLDEFITRE
ncbi:MAG: DUF1553 domain-containing protein [Planctomycetota bacterium]|nr:DUF1553 domain-containing protein [Planctomycetota bacterium]